MSAEVPTSDSKAESDFGIDDEAYRVMCHHYETLDELTEAERREVLEAHEAEELEAEFTPEELGELGLEA